MSNHIIAFVHIEKCAGTSVISALRAAFGRHHFDMIPRDKNQMVLAGGDLADVLKLDRNVKSIAGHSLRTFSGFDSECDRDFVFYTLIRDPVARFLSDYKYFREVLGYEGNLVQFIEENKRHNFLVKSLSGVESHVEAIRVVKEKIALLGDVDNFDCFLSALGGISNVNFEHFKGKKTNTSTTRKKKVQEESINKYIELIEEVNDEDIKFYKYVKENMFSSDNIYLNKNNTLFNSDVNIESKQKTIPSEFKKIQNLFYRNFIYKPYMGYAPLATHALPVYRDVIDKRVR